MKKETTGKNTEVGALVDEVRHGSVGVINTKEMGRKTVIVVWCYYLALGTGV